MNVHTFGRRPSWQVRADVRNQLMFVRWCAQAMAQTYVGKDMQVTIVDVRRESNRFVGNMIEAMQNKAFNKLKVRLAANGCNSIRGQGLSGNPRGVAIARALFSNRYTFACPGQQLQPLTVPFICALCSSSMSARKEKKSRSERWLYNLVIQKQASTLGEMIAACLWQTQKSGA